MPIPKQYIVIAGWVVVAIAATILITSIFKGSRTPNEELYKEYKEHLEAEVVEAKEQLKTEVEYRNKLQENYDQFMRNDSVLMVLLQENKVKYVPINKGYAEIPSRINNISGNDEAIRRAFTDY